MPNATPPPYLQETELGSAPIKLLLDSMDQSYALGTVNQSMQRAEAWRQSNHDPRWRVHDMLYYGVVEQKKWLGTDIPRSAISAPIVFDQVETAFPKIMQALFGGEQWFDLTSISGVDPAVVRKMQRALEYMLQCSLDGITVSAMVEIGYAVHQLLQYGNGYLMLEYDPVAGFPRAEWVDIRDLYLDAGNPTPSVDTGRFIIHRRKMTIDELDALRKVEGMKIPDLDVLYHMAQSRRWTVGDDTKRASEAARGVQFSPGFDDVPALPSAQEVEVLIYTSAGRIIWVLNREWVAYNEKNPYAFMPYVGAPCYLVTGRHYAQGFGDVLESNQLYIQALMNARIDELHLSLQPPRTKKQGVVLSKAAEKWGPGMLAELANAKDDMIVHFPQQASANVGQEVQWIEIQAEKRTGVNAMGQGAPRGGNINRTLGGVQMQMEAGNGRLQTIVKNVEDFMLVPLLHKMIAMLRVHKKPEQQLLAREPDGKIELVPIEVFNSGVAITARGASKMLTRQQLQGVFPVLAQYLLGGPLIQALTQQGKTVDFEEFLQVMFDATGVDRRYQLIRELNEREQQALQQPNPQVQAMMQKAQQDAQIRTQAMQLKHQSEMTKHQLEYDADIQETEEKSARELVKLLSEQQSMGQEVENSRRKAEVELQGLVQKMSLEQQGMMMKLLTQQRQHEQGMRQRTESTQVDVLTQFLRGEGERQQTSADAALRRSLTAKEHRQKLAVGAESGMQKLRQKEEEFKLKQAQRPPGQPRQRLDRRRT